MFKSLKPRKNLKDLSPVRYIHEDKEDIKTPIPKESSSKTTKEPSVKEKKVPVVEKETEPSKEESKDAISDEETTEDPDSKE